MLSVTKSVVGLRGRDPGRPRRCSTSTRDVDGLRPRARRERVRRRDRPAPARHAQRRALPRGVHRTRTPRSAGSTGGSRPVAAPGERARGLYPFLETLRAEAPHGSRFLYRSAETDVLGWVCERAGGARMADLVSTLVWAPMGAEHDAEIICDGLGTAVHDGGLAATARDLLRFGQMLLDGGVVPDEDGGPRHRRTPQVAAPGLGRRRRGPDAASSESPAEVSFPGGWYRNQFWFRPGEHGDVLLCLGIHGQMVHVSRRTGTVCVKLSSWPDPSNPAFLQDTLRAFDAVGGAMLNRVSTGGRAAACPESSPG